MCFLCVPVFNKVVLIQCHYVNNDHTAPFAEKSDFDVYRPCRRTNTCLTPDSEFTLINHPAACYDICSSFLLAVSCIEYEACPESKDTSRVGR